MKYKTRTKPTPRSKNYFDDKGCVCNSCNTYKEYQFIIKEPRYPNGYGRRCKECHNELNRQSYLKRQGKTKVYMLPNEDNYVGISQSMLDRARRGRRQGMDYSDYRILMECDTRKDAEELEALLHDMGYPGKYGYKKNPSH